MSLQSPQDCGGTTLLGVPGWAALNCLYSNFGQTLSSHKTNGANATHEALSVGMGSQEPLPSLVTRQGGELTSMVWLNGEFRTKPWTQVVSGATPSPLDLHVDEVSGDESTEPEGT